MSPLLVVLLLLGLPRLLPTSFEVDHNEADRLKEMELRANELPYIVGQRWVAKGDHDIPDSAIELLRPNFILGRRYQRIGGGPMLDFLVVHCTDVRDMTGHYPPICYPSSGWVAGEESATMLRSQDAEIPAREYQFSRTNDVGLETRIRVFNFFILPGGEVTDSMEDVSRRAERRLVSARGIAQLQILMPQSIPESDAIKAANDFLGAVTDLLEIIGFNQQGIQR
jgi:hypothetical protein